MKRQNSGQMHMENHTYTYRPRVEKFYRAKVILKAAHLVPISAGSVFNEKEVHTMQHDTAVTMKNKFQSISTQTNTHTYIMRLTKKQTK